MKPIEGIYNSHKNAINAKEYLKYFSASEINQALRFLSSMPGYEATPLYRLDRLSDHLGVKEIYVKDESERFGLNAFKGLGGAYGVASYFANELSVDLNTTHFEELVEKVSLLPKATFSTVTAGNHGKGLAWASQLFNQDAKVYMPKGASKSRLEAVREFGAESYLSDMNYDDTVVEIAKQSEDNHWVLFQDTAWPQYEVIPLYIMQGYTAMIGEIIEQLKTATLNDFTHVFLQAGVGSFAASIAAAFYQSTTDSSAKIIIVEPRKANCLYQSALSESGEPKRVYGLDTMMAGLACGEPNPFAWNILKSISDSFISIDDSMSKKGMRVLGNPFQNDQPITSGESGAAPLGTLYELLSNPQNEQLKSGIGLDDSSKVLLINTEGDTNRENYKKVLSEVQHS